MEIPPPQETTVGTRKEAGCLPENAVLAFVRRELDKAQRRSVEAHMARCSECRRLVSYVVKLELSTPR